MPSRSSNDFSREMSNPSTGDLSFIPPNPFVHSWWLIAFHGIE
jgi:hypothetical protein